MKMMLLMYKITWLTNVEWKEVKMMCEFISIFYGVWWLQGYLGVKATMNDLKAMQQMIMYRQHRQLVSDTCIASWRRHTWYLTQELVVLSLEDVHSEIMWQLLSSSRRLWILSSQGNLSFH